MSQIPSVTSQASVGGQSKELSDALGGLDMDHFFQLMVAELQNQDPLDPTDNQQLLQQISQIREVGATDRLTDTLGAVLLGQNVSNATSLIGKVVSAIDKQGNRIDGEVDRVTIIDGSPTLHIEGSEVALSNVSEVKAA